MNRILQGFWAGTMAGAIKNIFDLIIFYGLPFQKYRYVDHASGVLYSHPPFNITEFIFALFIDIWFSAFLGLVFFLIITNLKGKSYLAISWIYGSGLWFLVHALGSVLKVPTFANMAVNTLIIHFITDSLYGITLGMLYQKYLLKKDEK